MPADFPDFLLGVVTLIRIEIHPENRGQHVSGQVFGVIPGHLLGLAEAVVFGKIAVLGLLLGDGQPDGGGDQAMGFVGGVPGAAKFL